MKISVVSPSFNQASFIDRTIASVADQLYANKQHIFVDANSTDGSVDKILAAEKKYPHVRAIIEPDNGQSDAINKGFRNCDGEILAWLNTDDFYHDNTVFEKVAKAFQDNPDADIIYGRGWRLDAAGEKVREAWINRDVQSPWDFWKSLGILQPSLFFRRSVFETVGGLKDEYSLQLDYEYWIRMAKAGFKFKFVNEIFSCAVVHGDAKSTRARLAQLSECIAMLDEHYGEVPKEWFERLGDFFVTEIDQKTETGEDGRDSMAKAEAANTALFVEQAYKGQTPRTLPRERYIVTAFDSKYFHQGINMLAGLHRSSFLSFDKIYVYSLGLSATETGWLNALHKVEVVDLPAPPVGFPDFNEPKGRAYKSAVIATEGLSVPEGANVLWIDAGITPCADIESIFAELDKSEFFITNHDDSRHWPFYNIQFTHPEAIDALKATTPELMAPHMCSAIVGYRKGGKFQPLIDEARRLGRRRAAIMWPKVLERDDPARGPRLSGKKIQELRTRALKETFSVEKARQSFPYYGHRTQSIYSVLCHRMSAPTYSSSIYRQGNEASTSASQRNWTAGADKTKTTAVPNVLEGLKPNTQTFHHRGTYTDLSGLMYRRSLEPAFVVGNGPSLAGFDFNQLRGRVWVGMNAAYRYWDEIGIYPTIYCCLDLVVQDSHKEEIKRLIEQRVTLGIEFFFLRKTFADFWPEVLNIPGVYFFDDLEKEAEWFDRGKVTTGSFSAYFCAFLGHTSIYLLGIDLNYVEKIAEADVEGRELVVTREIESNPNYFFAGYQKPGDRYNPPNRHANMHLRSWNESCEVLSEWGVSVQNCNPDSAVQCFPFVSVKKALRTIDDPFNRSMFLAQDFARLVKRQTIFRNRLLARLGCKETETFIPNSQHVLRTVAWYRAAQKGGASTEIAVEGPRVLDVGVADKLSAKSLLIRLAGCLMLASSDEQNNKNWKTQADSAIALLGDDDEAVKHFRNVSRFVGECAKDPL